jgi:hypothetical protein
MVTERLKCFVTWQIKGKLFSTLCILYLVMISFQVLIVSGTNKPHVAGLSLTVGQEISFHFWRKPKSSSLCSQKPTTEIYPKPIQSSPRSNTLFI